MSIRDDIEQRIRNAENHFLDVLRRNFRRNFELPAEELRRLELEALKDLLSDDGTLSWGPESKS